MKNNKLKDILMVVLGNFLLALIINTIIIPNNILTGGLAGLSVGLKPFFNIDQKLFISSMTIILFVAGSILLDREFIYKTIISSFLFPLFVYLLSPIKILPFNSILVASIYAGIGTGFALGLVFRTNASTGGMDIPALIINKYLHISLGTSVLVIDTLTVFLGITSYGLENALIGIVSVYTSSIAINFVVNFGTSKAISAIIISDKYLEIIKVINEELDRGCTILYGEGGYSGDSKKVILVVIKLKQYNRLMEICKEIDENYFLITQQAREVHGLGFSKGL